MAWAISSAKVCKIIEGVPSPLANGPGLRVGWGGCRESRWCSRAPTQSRISPSMLVYDDNIRSTADLDLRVLDGIKQLDRITQEKGLVSNIRSSKQLFMLPNYERKIDLTGFTWTCESIRGSILALARSIILVLMLPGLVLFPVHTMPRSVNF